MTNAHELTLYFSPLSCSFASRAVIYEVEANARFVEVGKDGKTADGKDYRTTSPLGLVPALVLEDGEILTENAAVLQYLGTRFSARRLVPTDARELVRMQSWLSFIGTELHKVIFQPLLRLAAPPEVKAVALSKAEDRMNILALRLGDRSTALESGVSVADAYLTAVLNWVPATPIDLKRWPSLATYHANMLKRPAFGRAFVEERKLWAERNPEQAQALASSRS